MATTSSDAQPSVERRVGEAAVRAWHVAGEESQLVPWASLAEHLGNTVAATALGPVILVPRLRHAECVLATAEPWMSARHALRALVDQGWVVNALVPLGELGTAHEVFRGLPLRLQGWWERDDRVLAFTDPEVA
ncbi:MAG TPA: hypothetical protein VGL47_46220 [Amycolatopsis sp.]|uniref:hypothetical protein n=1 Tax=Amycolatopsis sp. TaxID=37632 RepID=UPI002F4137D9